jgi:hypothetical protein
MPDFFSPEMISKPQPLCLDYMQLKELPLLEQKHLMTVSDLSLCMCTVFNLHHSVCVLSIGTPLSVGPATSSPKEQQTTHVQPNTLSPVPMQLTVTSSGGDPSEVDSLDGPRVGSARRQWNQPQSVVVEGLALSSMEEVSKQVAELADGSLHKLINLRTAMEERRLLIDSLPVAEDSYDTGSHYPLTMWKSLPKEVFEIFQSLKETEGKLKEMNHCMDLLSKQFEPTSELRTRRKIDSDS